MKSYFSGAPSAHKNCYSCWCSACIDLFFPLPLETGLNYGISTQDHTWVQWKRHRRNVGNWIRLNTCCRNHRRGDSLKLESVGLHDLELCAGLPLSTHQSAVDSGRETWICTLPPPEAGPKTSVSKAAPLFSGYISRWWLFTRGVLEGSSAFPVQMISVQGGSSSHWRSVPQGRAENTLILENFFL